MSLAALVDYAQTSFGLVSGSTTEDPIDGSQLSESLVTTSSPRAPVPDWVRNRRPENEAPGKTEHGWRITEEAPVPPPPVDVDLVGIDALAFYAPFHLYLEDWGVYVHDWGVRHLACILKRGSLVPGDEPYLRRAENLLVSHEIWHAATEIACTRSELLARRSLYRDYFVHRQAAIHEEALANAHAVRTCYPEGASAERWTVERWMRRQGPGYRDFGDWTQPRQFFRGQNVAVWCLAPSRIRKCFLNHQPSRNQCSACGCRARWACRGRPSTWTRVRSSNSTSRRGQSGGSGRRLQRSSSKHTRTGVERTW